MIVVILFVFMVAMFIINFIRQQIKKHKDILDDRENQNKDKNNA